MYIVIFTICVFFFTAGFTVGLFYILKRVNASRIIHKNALMSIGNEVSIYSDKGAKFAYKGICSYLNNDHSVAIKHFEKALRYSTVSQNNAFCFEWMSKCYDAQDKPSESLNCCVKAVESEPSNLKSLFSLAEMYGKRGAFLKAEFYYKQILRYDKDNIAAMFMLGTLSMGLGLYDQAESQFLKTLEIDNESEAALAELSVIMAIKGDYWRMTAYYEKIKKSCNNRGYVESERLEKRLNSIKKMKDLCKCNDY
ncbi:MAG: hypothetical protein FWF94_06905 [Oscillospiraceae bacterium]|nr:hypothetical protein [Oscillospiraceae bacterium]